MIGETIGKIGNQFNYDDVYFRMTLVALAKTMNKSIRWINRFKDENICVKCAMTYRMFGQERFLLDSFVDDITDKRVELNTDQIPRGVITMTSFNPTTDEMANPNLYIAKDARIHNEYKKIITKVKAVPISINFDVEIKLDDHRDVLVCSQKILNFLHNYYFFSMNYFGIKIDLAAFLPDDKTVTLPTDGDMTSDNVFSIKFPLTVRTYYPIWKVDTDDIECYNEEFENIKRVYWESYIYEMEELQNRKVPENINDPNFQNSNPKNDASDSLV